jgi:hypothetical protein
MAGNRKTTTGFTCPVLCFSQTIRKEGEWRGSRTFNITNSCFGTASKINSSRNYGLGVGRWDSKIHILRVRITRHTWLVKSLWRVDRRCASFSKTSSHKIYGRWGLQIVKDPRDALSLSLKWFAFLPYGGNNIWAGTPSCPIPASPRPKIVSPGE